MELITVKQLPIIEENLKSISEDVLQRVETAKNIICTEETLKDVRSLRASLNNEFKDLEAQRKATKDIIIKPYNELEKIYKPLITEVFGEADQILKEKINSVENLLKKEKRSKNEKYFIKCLEEKHLDSKYLNYEDLNINITLGISDKKLNEEVEEKVTKVVNDIETINSMESSEEILVEYIKTKDINQSIRTVNERHEILKQVHTDKTIIEEMQEVDVQIEQETVNNEEQPIVENKGKAIEELETYEFKVTCTNKKAKELVEFLKTGGYIYE